MKRDGESWKCTGMINKLVKNKNGNLVILKDREGKREKVQCKNRASWNYVEPAQTQAVKGLFGMGK